MIFNVFCIIHKFYITWIRHLVGLMLWEYADVFPATPESGRRVSKKKRKASVLFMFLRFCLKVRKLVRNGKGIRRFFCVKLNLLMKNTPSTVPATYYDADRQTHHSPSTAAARPQGAVDSFRCDNHPWHPQSLHISSVGTKWAVLFNKVTHFVQQNDPFCSLSRLCWLKQCPSFVITFHCPVPEI